MFGCVDMRTHRTHKGTVQRRTGRQVSKLRAGGSNPGPPANAPEILFNLETGPFASPVWTGCLSSLLAFATESAGHLGRMRVLHRLLERAPARDLFRRDVLAEGN